VAEAWHRRSAGLFPYSLDKEESLMKAMRRLWLMVVLVALAIAGRQGALSAQLTADDTGATKAQDKQDDDAKIKANLAKLSAADRKLAEAQKWCVIEDENRLGSMGVPLKILVKNQPVFLCCKGCTKEALAEPDKTLAKVKELKTKAAKSSEK
jgi:hypothetical protein